MQAYVEPLDRLREALRWFVAVHELLLLHVSTGAELRVPALAQIAEAQHDAGDGAAIFVSTVPAENSAEDWDARIDELGEGFTLIAEEAAKATPAVTLKAPNRSSSSGLDGFIIALARYADALAPAFGGIILALAPEGITQPDAWLADLRRLFSDTRLKKVRFILVELEPMPALPLAVELGGLGERVDIRVDPKASQQMLRVMVAGMRSAPRGADGYRMAGMAGPKEAPPPRRKAQPAAPAVAAEELQQAGANPVLAQPEVMQALRVEALSASLAMSEGRPQEAVQFQVKARDIADRAGLVRETTLMDLMLGGYLVQGGALGPALDVFRRSATRARELALPDLEAQAQMATGGVLLANGRPFDAAEAYAAGARAAEPLPSKSIAIECNRMIGQILLAQGREAEAVTAWQRALQLADAAPKEERALSSAPVAAKDLAAVYRRHGLSAQADSLEAQIAAWQAAAMQTPDTVPPTEVPPAADGDD